MADEQPWEILIRYLLSKPKGIEIYITTPYDIKDDSQKCTKDRMDTNWFCAMMAPPARFSTVQIVADGVPPIWRKGHILNHDIRDLLYWLETNHYCVISIRPEVFEGDHFVTTYFGREASVFPTCPPGHIPFAAK